MATTTDSTLHQALDIARRLSPRDRAQLITVLVRELAEPTNTPQAAETQTSDKPAEDPWDVMDRIGKHLSAKGQLSNSGAGASAAANTTQASGGGEAWDHVFRVMDEISVLPRTGPLSPMEDLMQGRR